MPPPIVGASKLVHSFLARHVKVWKAAYKEATKAVKSSFPKQAQVEGVLVRNTPRQPLHPAARIRQSQSRWYSTSSWRDAVRRFSTAAESQQTGGLKNRSAYPRSRVGAAVNRHAGRAPFASTLRPNLTGGTLGRTSGGYSIGGGARYFSHTPAAQAQVVQNVSQAVRAFFISGHKAQFNGVNARSGEKKYKSVTALQEETGRRLAALPKATPGSYIDFSVNPTITALTPLSGLIGYVDDDAKTLNSEGLIDVLSVDFSRALRDLAVVLNDLKKVSSLGDLPITYHGSSLRVHFPGCDADTVERLCEELDVQRGMVVQDEDFDVFAGTEIALMFPFAPSTPASDAESDCGELYYEPRPKKEQLEWHTMITSSSSEPDIVTRYSMRSEQSDAEAAAEERDDDDMSYAFPSHGSNPWRSAASTPSGYESLKASSVPSGRHSGCESALATDPLEYQGFEGIYRFIEQCDAVRRH